MNFTEAVQALRDGLCEGIKHPAWTQRYAPQFLILTDNENELAWTCGSPFMGVAISQMLADDWEMVNPKPQMETVQESAWLRVYPNGYSLNKNKPAEEEGVVLVELTGTYQREVKRKVKRRLELGFNTRRERCMNAPESASIYCEWEEAAE